MKIQHFYDQNTATFTYIVIDEKTNKCVIIDPIMDYEAHSGRATYQSADHLLQYIDDNNLTVELILETHIHADHLTSADYLRNKTGAKIAIGNNIKKVIDFWVPIFADEKMTSLDADKFDFLLEEGDKINIGELEIEVIYTPGHTPACTSYKIGNAIFVGDTLFKPSSGTARVDFPGGSAEDLYNSIQKLLSLPEDMVVYLCHDYPEEGEKPTYKTTIADTIQNNIMVGASISRKEFISKREARDRKLSVPKLIIPSIQVNLRAGHIGDAHDNGTQYLKIPINKL